MLDFPKGNNKNRKGPRRTQLKWWFSPMERLSCEWNSLPSVHKRFARKSRQLVKFFLLFSFFYKRFARKSRQPVNFFLLFLFSTKDLLGNLDNWSILFLFFHKRLARKSRQLVTFFLFFLFFTCSYVGQVPG